MKNLITLSDFAGDGLELGITAGSENEIFLNKLITEQQSNYLISVLGDIEYSKLLADCTVNNYPVTNTWVRFLEGYVTDAVYAGKTHKIQYTGFTKAFRYLIYLLYQKKYMTVPTQSGEKTKTLKNSTFVASNQKMIENWNYGYNLIGFDWSGKFSSFYEYSYDTFEMFTNTVYNYLYWTNQADATKFADWDFLFNKQFGLMNEWGL